MMFYEEETRLNAKQIENRNSLPKWIQIWLLFSSIVCALDALFVILRPQTFINGRFDSILWKPWHTYMEIDKRYGDMTDPFVVAQSWMNLAEIVLNVFAILMSLLRRPLCNQLAYSASLMTFWKTVLYTLLYVAQPPGAEDYHGHNNVTTMILMFWIPNGIWLLIPGLIVLVLACKANGNDRHHLKEF